MDDPNRAAFGGVFKYHEKDDGWSDTFRVVDDDGMPFDFKNLRRFEGKTVRITIEVDPWALTIDKR